MERRGFLATVAGLPMMRLFGRRPEPPVEMDAPGGESGRMAQLLSPIETTYGR